METENSNAEPRPWVVRLGSYIRIFGKASSFHGHPPRFNDGLIVKAQNAEREFGKRHG